LKNVELPTFSMTLSPTMNLYLTV